MTQSQKRRLTAVLIGLGGVGLAVTLAVTALGEYRMYFVEPSRIAAGEVEVGIPIRAGGMVVDGSVQREPDSLRVRFVLTDYAEQVPVEYEGILPDLFREGQGIIAIGRLDERGVVVADEIMAKHDEGYMPPEVAATLKERP